MTTFVATPSPLEPNARVNRWRQVTAFVPMGSTLPNGSWRVRHRAIQSILALHIPGLMTMALLMGTSIVHAALDVGPLVIVLGVAAAPWLTPRYRSTAASAGLIGCSGLLVHISGGYIEMHFHFFVMVVLISLYEDWLALVVAIAFVVLHHGGLGVIAADSVYKNPEAVAHPWRWALVHSGFVLAACAASIASWRLNERLRNRSALVLDSVGEGICGINVDGRITFANRAAQEILGVTEPLAGSHVHDVFHGGDSMHGPESCPLTLPLHSGSAESRREVKVVSPGGDVFTGEFSMTPLASRQHREGAVLAFRDISQRKGYEEQLIYQTLYDELTGLANRRLFSERIGMALARSLVRAECAGVMFIDVDRFKHVNDSLGHYVGDQLLRALARELRKVVRDGDTVARLGGDEFGILFERLRDPGELDEISKRLTENLRRPLVFDGRELGVSVSIGIATSTPERPYVLPDEVLRDADMAMYEAKAIGGARAVTFQASMSQHQLHQLELEADLRTAIERGELLLHYQPDFDLESGALDGFEALIRWNHPKFGLVHPTEFIHIAEHSGQIVTVGAWVISEACRQLSVWRTEHPRAADLVMSINLSLSQLEDPGIVELIRGEIERNQLPPATLKFELTESEMMRDTATTLAILQDLKALGVNFAIDDFGTGYSSLSYLQQFPVSTLKIYRSFLVALEARGTFAILRAIMALADALGCDVTAEGIETPAQRTAMMALGCQRGQGYLFSKALHADDARTFLDGLGDAVPYAA